MFKFLVFIVLLGVLTSPILTFDICDTSRQNAANGRVTFHLYLQKVNRHSARRICKEEGGDLAVIRSSADENIILKMMAHYSVQEVWIGLQGSTEYGWTTVSDEPLNHVGWSRWQYNGPYAGCAVLKGTGNGMVDHDCEGVQHRFVCQKLRV